jgi:hypothetical protein
VKLRINKSHRAVRGGFRVSTKAQEITIDTDPRPLVRTVADAAKEALAAGIRAVSEDAASGKHRRWNRTGHLSGMLRVDMIGDTAHVRPPDDRLNFEGAVSLLTEDVRAAREPQTDPRVKSAVRKAVGNMVTVKKSPLL